jgi:carbon monoxide dehydrogenase subunit G
MKIANEFTVHVPIETAWKVLTDLEGIAPCLPGAQLTGVDGDIYKGKVKVKVGPVISEFAGTAKFVEKDDTAYRGVIDAKGRDARSAGNAAATITARLRPDGDSTVVSVDTDLKISGKLAQFGSGMIKEVSEKLLGQFVASLEAKIAADNPAAASSAEAGPAVAAPDEAVAAEAAPSAAGSEADVLGDGTDHADAAAPTTATTDTVSDESPAGHVVTAGGGSANGRATPAVATGGPVVGDDAASADIEAAREVAGDDAPLSETISSHPSSEPLLAPGGADALAAVEESPRVPKRGFKATAEPEPLDLMALAGGSIRKRLIPVAIGAVIVAAAIIIWRVSR